MTDKKSPPEGWPGLVVDYTEEKKKRADYFQARTPIIPRRATSQCHGG